MNDIEQRIKSVISHQLSKPVAAIQNDKSFSKDLGVDSLDMVSLLVALEEEFGILISDEDAVKIKTVQDTIDYSNDLMSQKL